MVIPTMMTTALNQLVFVPGLLEVDNFHRIGHQKLVYIPKVPQLVTPSGYCRLSMIEVLYKIPFRILSAQELSLLAAHLIQDAIHYQKPL
jgi:hypothetical protein